jgi:hypothetical protein
VQQYEDRLAFQTGLTKIAEERASMAEGRLLQLQEEHARRLQRYEERAISAVEAARAAGLRGYASISARTGEQLQLGFLGAAEVSSSVSDSDSDMEDLPDSE